jgi:hypothetical protein
MKRLLVPGLPFLVSLTLSLSTVGTHVYWQDSGFYLTAVHDLGVLYPHGFVVYQLLCKAWISLLFFMDFVLAVHLFSSLCCASAAAVLALAARDFLGRGKGEFCGVLAGTLFAAGYTFWFSGIYAKGYALYYLVLALLLWVVVRTAAAPTKRGAATVAGLAGLAWAVHPSIALGGAGLAVYFLRASRTLGPKSAALCLTPAPLIVLLQALILSMLAVRDVEHSMGRPVGPGAVFQYILGSRFTGVPGVFGLEASRVAGLAAFVWEEYLGIGLALVGLGVWSLSRTRRGVLLPGLLWILPYVSGTLLFKIEGQSDHWYVAACIPLVLALAAGLEVLGLWFARPDAVRSVAAGLALTWSAVVNGRDLRLRDYDLAEVFGMLHLRNLEADAVLFAHTDDVIATTWAMQSVRGFRTDVIVVNSSQLGAEELWYDRLLQRRHPELKLPAGLPETVRRDADVFVAAYLAANASGPRPLYVTSALAPELLPPGTVLVPQGVVWRLLPAGEDKIEPGFWDFPLEPEQVPARFGRRRGLAVSAVPGGFECEVEPYERRLQRVLIKARVMLADWQFRHGQYASAVRLYESVLPLDPKVARNESVLHFLALGYVSLGKSAQAEAAFRETLAVATRPWVRASSWLALGDLARGRGDAGGARQCYGEASRIPGLSAEQQAVIRERVARPER